MAVTTDLQRFRFYADGSEAGAAALAAQNTNAYVDVTTGNVDLALRVGLQETGNATLGGGDLPVHFEFSRNAGAWTPLTTATSGVRSFDSASLTNDGATTSRLTGGTGSFNAGKVTEDGISANITLAALAHTEALATLRLIAADMSDGDVIDFRAYINGIAATYAVVPRIVAVKDPSSRFFSMFFS